MQAVEFIGKPHDGVVDLPTELRGWNGRRVRVILLDEESAPTTATSSFTTFTLKTRDFRFDRDEANAR
ncbi:MAG: hypothetical protein ABL892_13760 [Thiobacillaceae bacterium]